MSERMSEPKYTKDFSRWYSLMVSIPHLGTWPDSRVKELCFRAWTVGRMTLRETLKETLKEPK